jgi:hypothetical protein
MKINAGRCDVNEKRGRNSECLKKCVGAARKIPPKLPYGREALRELNRRQKGDIGDGSV